MKTKLDFFANGETGVRQKGNRALLQTVVPTEAQLEYMTNDEILQHKGSALVLDIETYINYFLVCFRHVETNKVIEFKQWEHEKLNIEKLCWILWQYKIVGFNSDSYDLPILFLAIQGATNEYLKRASDDIIVNGMQIRDFYREYKIRPPKINHIDLIEVAPLQGSLKKYAARLHCERLQDLPYDPHKRLSFAEYNNVTDYCHNDTFETARLYSFLLPQIELREELSKQYKQDLRSHSDAQISEAVIASEIAKLNGQYPRRPVVDLNAKYTYKAPTWVQFQTPLLQKMLLEVISTEFALDKGGSPVLPKNIEDNLLNIGSGFYQMGFGGLHSQEKSVSYKADAHTLLIDVDVASFYPRIILNEKLYQKHLGPNCLVVYDTIVRRRLAAKAAKDLVGADSLKIVINGGFGKYGSMYSILYAPDLMIQVTMTGQLSLLMLIEAAELIGIPVVSANTDGLIFKCPVDREIDLQQLVKAWETQCGFQTEETRYKATYSRDVNNFFIVKTDNTVKVKGCYAEKGSAGNSVLSKNPAELICSDAIMKLITEDIPIEKTITECKDFRRFVVVREAKGGAEKNGTYLGKTVRWYYAVGEKGCVNYVGSGNKVGTSDGGKPCMILPKTFPDDINYAKYIADTEEMLYDIGYKERPQAQVAFW